VPALAGRLLPGAVADAIRNRGNLYVFGVLLPFALPSLRKVPARLAIPSLAAAAVALGLGILVNAGSNTARSLFSALGPLLAIATALTLIPISDKARPEP
jgi:hypothetical protein